MNIRLFIQRHQLINYFVLAYGITWGGICVLLASKGFQLTAIHTQDLMVIYLLMVLGPSVSSIVLHTALEGRNGMRELWARFTNWNVGLRWYAVALLTVPLLLLAILTVLSALVSPAFTPSFRITGLAIGLLAGGLEEIGWTGFATPRLLKKYNVLLAGCLLGLLWAFWHLLADFSGNFSTMGAKWIVWFATFWIVPLTVFRALMTWVYSHTQSLLLAQLMHASYTGWLFILSPVTSFSQGLLWQTVFALSLWGVLAIGGLGKKARVGSGRMTKLIENGVGCA